MRKKIRNFQRLAVCGVWRERVAGKLDIERLGHQHRKTGGELRSVGAVAGIAGAAPCVRVSWVPRAENVAHGADQF